MTGDPEGLPDPFADWRGLAPVAVRWRCARAALLALVPVAGFLVAPLVLRDVRPAVTRGVAAGLAAILTLNVARTLVWSRRFRFRLTGTTAETRARVIGETTRVVPLGRIQHVDVTAGPVERSLEVATVSAHTAAGESTIVIPGVAAAEAEAIRERLLRERRGEAV
jgi:hypothetical protein